MTTDPVDEYLDELADASRLRGRRLRHLLAEVEDHLTTSRAEHRATGLPDADAGRRAIEEFGPPAEVAAALDRAAAPSAVAVLREAARSLVLLGAVGLLAIGLSGLLAAAGGAALGKAFVSGDGPDVTYSATRCADLQEYHPSPTCEQAATGHHYDEVVGYRLAAGVLGLVVLGGWFAVVRPWRRGPSPAVLPRVVRSGGRRHGLRGGRLRAAADRGRRGGAVRHGRRGRQRAVRGSGGRGGLPRLGSAAVA